MRDLAIKINEQNVFVNIMSNEESKLHKESYEHKTYMEML